MNPGEAWYAVCDASDLPGGGSREFRVEGISGFALRTRGQLVAFVNACPHQLLALNWRPHDFLDAARQHIVCANHGAVFDPVSGACIAGPCAGTMLQPWPVREMNGRIEVTAPPR